MTRNALVRRLPLSTLAAAALLLLALTGSPATAQEPTGPTGTHLTLLAQTVWVGPNDTVLSRVKVRGAPENARIQIILHTKVGSRDGLVATHDGSSLGGHQLWQPPVPLDSFAPLADGSVDATLAVGFSDGKDVTTGRAIVTDPGVFPVEIRVLEGDNDRVLAQLVSYAVRLPAVLDTPAPLPLRVATVLPLQATPSSATSEGTAVEPTARERAAALVLALAANPGTTEQLPVALAATPEVLASLVASPTPGDPRLVSDLVGELGARPVIQQPYVALDLATWTADPNLVTSLDGLLARGKEALTSLAHRPDDPRLWVELPSNQRNPLTPASVDWLQQHGIEQVVLPETDLVALNGNRFTRTPGRPFQLQTATSTVQALTIDPQLQSDFAGGGALGANRVIADLAVAALDLPSEARGLVLVPPTDDPDATTLHAVLNLLRVPTAGPDSAPLVAASNLEDLFALPPADAAGDGRDSGETLVRQLVDPTPAESLGDFPTHFAITSRRAADLIRMLGRDGPLTRDAQRRLDDSAALGLPPATRTRLLDMVDGQINSIVARVSLPEHQTITLTSRSAVIPLTIRSALDAPATVVLHLDSSERLEFLDGDTQTVQLTGDVTHLRLRVRTRTPGDATLRMRLTSPQGELLLAESRYSIRSTAVSGVGLVISIGALAFLVLWWLRHGIRTRRERRAHHIPPAELFDLPDEAGHDQRV